MDKLTPKAKKEINKFLGLFPSRVTVRVHRSEGGKFCAEIITFPGCLTEADNFYELIEMINDAIRVYFEIPEKYSSFMPVYLCAIETARQFNAFPATNRKPEVMDFININAKANR